MHTPRSSGYEESPGAPCALRAPRGGRTGSGAGEPGSIPAGPGPPAPCSARPGRASPLCDARGRQKPRELRAGAGPGPGPGAGPSSRGRESRRGGARCLLLRPCPWRGPWDGAEDGGCSWMWAIWGGWEHPPWGRFPHRSSVCQQLFVPGGRNVPRNAAGELRGC